MFENLILLTPVVILVVNINITFEKIYDKQKLKLNDRLVLFVGIPTVIALIGALILI